MPKCKHCHIKFKPKYFNQKYCLCSDNCTKAFAEFANSEKEKAKAKKTESAQWKKENQKMIEGTKKLSYFEKKLEDEINAIVRLIDYGLPCISSGLTKFKVNAGHYHSVGANKTLRYNLHNIHIQSVQSNNDRGGDIIRYGAGLIEWYGKKYRDFVEYDIVRMNPLIKWNGDQLKEWTIVAREIKNQLKKDNKTYTAEQRVEMREKFNQEIGIYK